jgi:hypothetical protein
MGSSDAWRRRRDACSAHLRRLVRSRRPRRRRRWGGRGRRRSGLPSRRLRRSVRRWYAGNGFRLARRRRRFAFGASSLKFCENRTWRKSRKRSSRGAFGFSTCFRRRYELHRHGLRLESFERVGRHQIGRGNRERAWRAARLSARGLDLGANWFRLELQGRRRRRRLQRVRSRCASCDRKAACQNY